MGWFLKKSISSSLSGWFEVKDQKIIELIKSLQQKLNDRELPLIESHDRNWFRISALRENIFFNGEFFTFALRKPRPEGWELQLFTEARESPLGQLPKTVLSIPIHAEAMFLYLKSVEKDEEDEDIYDDPANMMRKHLDPLVRKTGLRKLVRTSKGIRGIVCLPENP